jgi:GntR family transcriptional repressor for pyruvate dehydrogenase complex
MDILVPLERRKLFQQVASHLEREILDGHLKPGDRLPTERDLQTRFGVGRPAIREALILLQRNGLIEISNGTAARVAMPTASHLLTGMMPGVMQMLSTEKGQHHFQQVRLFFETGLARYAAANASPARIEQLQKALTENQQAMGDRARFIATDIAFHYALAEIAENPVLTALHDAMSEWLKQQREVTLEQPDQERIAFTAHETIFKAVARHDADAAETAMRNHLLQLETAYWGRSQNDLD